MNKILSKKFFSDNVAELVVEAPLIARSRRAGHFVIIRVDANSERVPLTIAGADIDKGTITLVVQQVGASTHKLLAMQPGECLHDVVGPLGRATRIEKYGTVVCACGGVGAAPMLPIADALNKAGNKMKAVCADVFDLLKQYEAAGEKFDVIVLDPPAFTKSAKMIEKAYGGYKEINLRAMRLLKPNGILVTCSCSYFMETNMFCDMIMHAAMDSHRRVQILEKHGAGPDHPVLLGYPKSDDVFFDKEKFNLSDVYHNKE